MHEGNIFHELETHVITSGTDGDIYWTRRVEEGKIYIAEFATVLIGGTDADTEIISLVGREDHWHALRGTAQATARRVQTWQNRVWVKEGSALGVQVFGDEVGLELDIFSQGVLVDKNYDKFIV